MLSVINPLASWFDSAVAVGVKETNEPIRDAETPTPNVENLRLGGQAVAKKADELSPTTCLECLARNAEETMTLHHLVRLSLYLRHQSSPILRARVRYS
ncbi:MAG: hypothetical protein DMF61_20315 [Blastocatellia bacterium AA13]|nr:MAG: hypothetical protein DMF61_20315 [Blastocatellia bacterium AA13]